MNRIFIFTGFDGILPLDNERHLQHCHPTFRIRTIHGFYVDLSTSPKHLATIALLQHLFHQGHLHFYASHINQYAFLMFLIVACPSHTHNRELQYVDKGRGVHMPHGYRHTSTAVGHRYQVLKKHRITYHAVSCSMGYCYPTFYVREITLST